MRLWSIHPRYLDARGLVALWREALLAQTVLAGRTRGYRRHPQLIRFRAHPRPRAALASYLAEVHAEAVRRGYAFNAAKIGRSRTSVRLPLTTGQFQFELAHLRGKLWRRDRRRYHALVRVLRPVPHPLFRLKPGRIDTWERP